MADNPSKQGHQDDTRVNVNQEHELTYWSERFGVSRDQLKAAVNKVGVAVSDLEQHFSKQSAKD